MGKARLARVAPVDRDLPTAFKPGRNAECGKRSASATMTP